MKINDLTASSILTTSMLVSAKKTQPKFISRSVVKKQSGNVLMVVIFVVLVMTMLAVTLARLEWSNQDTQSREILGTKAWFMAYSANEWALTQLFPLGESGTSSDILPRCDDVNSNWQSNIISLGITDDSCEVISMSCRYPNIPQEYEQYRYYTLESIASCQDGGLHQVERAQQVVVKGVE